MIDPRLVAAGVLGPVDWQSEVSGFCRCPGEGLHTHANGKKDCRVNIDGAPTVFCFHSSCIAAVEERNRRLRRELGASPWEMTLPGGTVLRSGDVLNASGEVVAREQGSNSLATSPLTPLPQRRRGEPDAESLVLENLRVLAERFRADLFEVFRWPFDQVVAESPLEVADRDPEDQFRTWLKLWPAHCHVWIGNVYDSGSPEHRTNFRPVADWYQIGPCMGNFTCGSSFKPGSFSRCNENLNGERFMVIESDSLSKDEVGAVFAYLRRRLHYRLHCIIDTAGKSLHAWFDAPRNKVLENRLKAGLTVFGCDPKLFTYSQPVRVPGAYRDGKLQRLVWLTD